MALVDRLGVSVESRFVVPYSLENNVNFCGTFRNVFASRV